jgi:hypothetical protein
MTHHKIDGRTKRAADIALAKRQISPASYRALIEEGTITLQEAKAMGRDGAPAMDTTLGRSGQGTSTEASRSASGGSGGRAPDMPPQPVSRISKDDTTQECWCGCQEFTSPNRKWKPGHDQRGKGIIKRAVKEGKVGELSDRLREYGAERGLI